MKKYIILAILICGPSFVLADTHVADNCSLAAVEAAITAASSGDTVSVPAGECTWSSNLTTIDKGIILSGDGPGSTIITGTAGSGYMVRYAPATPALNEPFELTGFKFSSTGTAMLQIQSETANKLTNIRIHNNYFETPTAEILAFTFYGQAYGVFDNNTITGASHIDIYGRPSAGGVTSWTEDALTYGDADFMFFENNNINVCFTVNTHGHGGRAVWRYNTFGLTNPDLCYGSYSGFYPFMDQHGNQPSGVYAGMGVEIYGNKVENSSYNFNHFLHLRGGKTLIFYNKMTGSGTVTAQSVIEEYDDSISAPATHTVTGQPQHVSDSYMWNNRYYSDALMRAWTEGEDCCGDIAENSEWFNFDTTFDGTAGTGCGTLASLPATCTVGVGYWATDQSCETVPAASMGVNPSSPLSGSLHKCTSTDTWTSYYTPYTYPHPLTEVGGADTTPNSFSFTDVTGAALSTLTTTSPCVTVAGIDAGQTPAISISGAGCQYNVDGGAYTANAGTVGLDNVVCMQGTSSASYSTVLPSCTLTIGGVTDSDAPWTVATGPGSAGAIGRGVTIGPGCSVR